MISIQDNVLDYVEILSTYVPLFERWTTLFRPSDYTDLATSIKRTCAKFFSYLLIQFVSLEDQHSVSSTKAVRFKLSADYDFSEFLESYVESKVRKKVQGMPGQDRAPNETSCP